MSTTNPSRLLIRADASTEIGTGHVMRCLALAQAWMAGGGEALFVASAPDALLARIQDAGAGLVLATAERGSAADGAETARAAHECDAADVVLDGYAFGAAVQRPLREARLPVVILDDCLLMDAYECDMIVNPNITATPEMYADRSCATMILAGVDFAMLRPEFIAARRVPQVVPERATRLLVTFGGSDPGGFTAITVERLATSQVAHDMDVIVVVGAGFADGDQIERLAEGLPNARVERNPANIAPLMEWADIAVSACGSTCWEMCCLGVPQILIETVDNQAGVGAAVELAGAARFLGAGRDALAGLEDAVRQLAADRAARDAMARRGGALVDGGGAGRVCAAIRALA